MATDIRFTGAVDRRFAWLGNDAEGNIDLEPALVSFINTATSSVAVSSMTFSLLGVGDALANAANLGRTVRIVGNAGHRFNQGYFRSQRGPVQITDNNLPSLFVRISFQQEAAPPVPGFEVDTGLPFGPRPNGMSYGWETDQSSAIGPHGAPATFTTPLLGQCYARRNNQQHTWSIALPPGFYYVVVVTGEADFNSKSFVRAQGQTIFTFKDGTGLHYSEHTDCAAGEFKCSVADGGSDPDSGEPQGRRLDVMSGTLALLVGKPGQPSFSSLDYIEIYRASSTHPLGDPNLDRTLVQERQLHHTKFILLDAETPTPRLWTGSHNLTPIDVMNPRSEDFVTTDETAICTAFLQEFNRWWGASGSLPNPANSFHGRFKTPAIAPSGTMPGTLIPATNDPWRVCFSPTAAGLDMYQIAADHLSAATKDILFLMEQLTDSGEFGGLHGTTFLMNNELDPQVSSGLRMIGLFGNGDPTDSIFTRYAGEPNAAVAQSTTTHDKIVLIDTFRDTRQSKMGRMLCGSMNWSQGAFHVNDEQTLLLHDPALANKALQRAMAAYTGAGLLPVEPADIVIVVDRSFSMMQNLPGGMTRMQAAKTAADTFLDMVTADSTHRVALVRFGSTVEPFAPVETLVPYTNARRTTLHSRVSATNATLPIGNSTCYGLPLLEAQNLLTSVGSPHPRRVIVFLTDGEENTPPNADGIYQPLADNTGVEIHTTAFGPFDPFNTTGANSVLNDMAVYSGGTFAQIDVDPVHLQKRFAEVARDAMGMVVVMDPTFDVSGRAAVKVPVPLDMDEGIVQFCAFWGDGEGRVAATVRTPWGEILNPKQTGVTHLTGRGRDIWRVDVARIAKRAQRRAAGTWTVLLRAMDPRGPAVRTDVAVYASRGAGADLRVEIERDREGVRILARMLDGQRVAAGVKLDAVVLPPLTSKRRKARSVRLTRVKSKDPRWEGVVEARLPLGDEGVHTLHVVATGKTGRGEFRREQTITWTQQPDPPREPRKPEPEPLPPRTSREDSNLRRKG